MPVKLNPKEQSTVEQVAKNIRKYRDIKKLTQEELAHESGVRLNHFGKIERGTINPSITTIIKIARGLGISVSELLKGIK